MYPDITAIFTIGGTISCRYDTECGIASPALSGEAILRLPGLSASDMQQVELHEQCGKQSSDLSAMDLFALAEDVRAALLRPEISGVVILTGTDTLEEAAYLLSLWLSGDKPVVITGSMKSIGEPYSDAVGNLRCALAAARASASRGRGVLVCFNEQLYFAEDIVKKSSCRIDAFYSPHGAAGAVYGGDACFYAAPERHAAYPIQPLTARVELVRSCLGGTIPYPDGHRLPDGLVIEAMGAGNLPAEQLPAIDAWLAAGVPVLIVSRCPEPMVLKLYDYPGSAADLAARGCILCGALNGLRARLKLMVLLSCGIDRKCIAAHFAQGN